MDSITSYSANAASGGPAGELLIRRCLTEVLTAPGFFGPGVSVSLTVADSDESMLREGAAKTFDIYIFDPWTWAQKGWVLRDFAQGFEERVFVLDFFGSEKSYTPAGKGGGIVGAFDVGKQVRTGGGAGGGGGGGVVVVVKG